MRELFSLLGLLLALGLAARGVPATAWLDLGDPCSAALLGAGFVVVVLLGMRFMGSRGARAERLLVAAFLAGMPLVYVLASLRVEQRSALAFELAGLGLYAALAWLGLQRSPWFLVAGLAGHGLAWDLWHQGAYAHGITIWYPMACLWFDVGLALYVAMRIPHWHIADGKVM